MKYGMISTGSKEASEAALEILKCGGNAFDASIAAVTTSMTSEVNLTSMAGGGALLAYVKGNQPILFDFFVDAPSPKPDRNIEFYRKDVDFGDSKQSFHVGKGSVAVPGNIKGLFEVHNSLGKIPIKEVLSPAISAAKNGVKITESQGYITSLLIEILKLTPESKKLYFDNSRLMSAGDIFKNLEFAEILEWFCEDGYKPFYEGEIAKKMIDYLGQDSLLSMEDLNNYSVAKRTPLQTSAFGKRLFTNPSPSVGGLLICFFLNLLERSRGNNQITPDLIVKLMAIVSRARFDLYKNPDDEYQLDPLLSEQFLSEYGLMIDNLAINKVLDFNSDGLGSTTHVSIIDKDGNAASVTTTNGEGCGHILPGTGIMLNNMLGEEDLNPLGFHNWSKIRRMPTLISPSMVIDENGFPDLVIGSGGSNRIRSALIQVLIYLYDKSLSLFESVSSPRLHLEKSELYVEPGLKIDSNFYNKAGINVSNFKENNLFFGGVNAVSMAEAVGDKRRGGWSISE